MTTVHPAYGTIERRSLQIYRLSHLQHLGHWDQSTYMPEDANEARGAALSELGAVIHGLKTAPEWADDFERAQQEPLNDWQAANLRELQRQWHQATALPPSLVERRQMATLRCEHAWRQLRPNNDWAGFLPLFREVVAVAREEAQVLSQRLGVSPYEALMDGFEPGMRCAKVDEVFADLKQWLPALIDQALEVQDEEDVAAPLPAWPSAFEVSAQRQLCEAVMDRLGFNFRAGRLDVAVHPFCGGVPEDVRMTTRFDPAQFLSSLMGTIHETGHASYEQHLPREWLGQAVGEARSMAVHESQSLSFEMQLGRHPGFARVLLPLIEKHLGTFPGLSLTSLVRRLKRVEKGLIRVDADEVTYPAHILLCYDIERALIEGSVECADVPCLWDQGMRDLLGLDTRGNFKDGPMQDVHWPAGLFGYFPSYTLGAMMAAQWFHALRKQRPGLDEDIAAGDFQALFGFLERSVWSQASRWTTSELLQRATGEDLNPAHFRQYLESRYLGAARSSAGQA